MSITLAIADDHPLIPQGLQHALIGHAHISLQHIYHNGGDLLKGLSHAQPHVLLLDIRMPDKNGDELAIIILKKYPSVKIIAHTSLDGILTANNMLKLGVHGFLHKNTTIATVVQAIETVYNGGQFIEDSLQQKIAQIDKKIQRSVFNKTTLTKREAEILQLIVNGDTNDEIAKKLFLSNSTIDNYRSNILLKLDAKNTAQLVNIALKHGLAE